jgi:hypothetical protein
MLFPFQLLTVHSTLRASTAIMPRAIRTACDSYNDRSSDSYLQGKKHARKVRDLRHCGDFYDTRISMKTLFDIANPTALRPYGHGPAACGLLRRECAHKGFIHHD